MRSALPVENWSQMTLQKFLHKCMESSDFDSHKDAARTLFAMEVSNTLRMTYSVISRLEDDFALEKEADSTAQKLGECLQDYGEHNFRIVEALDNRLYAYEGMNDIVNYGIVMSSYLYFEHSLTELCHLYQSIKGLSSSVRDIQGDRGIVRAVRYLEEVVGIGGLKQGVLWMQITDWNKVRNAIAHKAGLLTESGEHQSAKRLSLGTRHVPGFGVQGFSDKVSIPLARCKALLLTIDDFLETCVVSC